MKKPPDLAGQLLGIAIIAAQLGACGRVTATAVRPIASADPPIRMDSDLNQAILTPEDVADVFPEATYSISQPLEAPESRGLIVTYPTRVIEHTTAFAEGFSTRIELFTEVNQAAQSYDVAVAQQPGKPLAIETVGTVSRAFAGKVITGEGRELDQSEYVVLSRQENVFITLTIRTGEEVSADRLSQWAALVLSRLPSRE